MPLLALDLGGTKLATAVFSVDGRLLSKELSALNGRQGSAVGALIQEQIKKQVQQFPIEAVGVSVPGISRQSSGTVWAPNIEGWEDYPLLQEMKSVLPNSAIIIDSDRACSIFGEQWQGNAQDCKHAIFMAIGTGIGAGIIDDGKLIRGFNDIAGAIGWMALPRPFESKYVPCGCFEFYASGAGIPKFTNEVLDVNPANSVLRQMGDALSAYDVFEAYEKQDEIATIVIEECIAFWGMGAANLVSIFNPEKIIFGGGLFGPAVKYLNEIKSEASKWAQPISIKQVSFLPSALGGDAAVYGAGYLASTLR